MPSCSRLRSSSRPTRRRPRSAPSPRPRRRCSRRTGRRRSGRGCSVCGRRCGGRRRGREVSPNMHPIATQYAPNGRPRRCRTLLGRPCSGSSRRWDCGGLERREKRSRTLDQPAAVLPVSPHGQALRPPPRSLVLEHRNASAPAERPARFSAAVLRHSEGPLRRRFAGGQDRARRRVRRGTVGTPEREPPPRGPSLRNQAHPDSRDQICVWVGAFAGGRLSGKWTRQGTAFSGSWSLRMNRIS